MRTIRVSCIGLLLVSLILGGSSTAKPPAAAAKASGAGPATATIYILRQHEFKLISFAFDIVVDGQEVGHLSTGTYLVAVRPAGRQSIDIKGDKMWMNDVHSEMDAAVGRTYFVEIGPGVDVPGRQLLESLVTGGAGLRGKPLPGSGGLRFFLLDEEEGRSAISGLKSGMR